MEAAEKAGLIKGTKPSNTENLPIWGAHAFTPVLHILLIQQYGLPKGTLNRHASAYILF